ncbi:unnamed protein product [Rotaria sordida]|uniref:Uncharacterized protein n=1 Tax=Rotaria sordida TaxID=392033 RepID=A0A815NTG1_9BILA|nr:unnamed protein product [Rotaria sordida]
MSGRSRVCTRALSRPQISSNSSTPISSRIRSITAHDKISPYRSLTRRKSNNGNKSTSKTLKRLYNDNQRMNDKQNDVFEPQLPDDEQQQQQQQNDVEVQSDDDGDAELKQNTTTTTREIINQQPTPADTTLISDFIQQFSLNDNNNTMSTTVRGFDPNNNKAVANCEVYKLFDQITNCLFRCKLCQQEVKTKRYTTTNLRKHLGFVHKRTEFLYSSQRKNYLPKSSSISIDRKKELHSAIISCIIKDSRCFNDFRKSGMRAFLAVAIPGYVPPHRVTVKAHLAKRYTKHRKLLRSALANIPAIALTSDVWKNNSGTYFISLTAHFRDINFNLISLTIGFRQLVGSHIAERLRKYILYEITSLNIQNKICSITTDNAANIVAATSNIDNFGMRISCLAHVLNLIIQDRLNLSDENIKDSSNDQSSSSKNKTNSIDAINGDEDIEYRSSDDDTDENENKDEDKREGEIEEVESSSDTDLGDDEISLGESSNDEDEIDLDNNTSSTGNTLMNLHYLVGRVRQFVRITRRIHILHYYFQEEAKRKKSFNNGLILDCIIRWNSSYYMLDRFVTYQDAINQITVNPKRILPLMAATMIHKLSTFIFSHDDWEHLTVTKDVLSIFEKACRLISGKKYQTISMGYVILVGLQHHLSRYTATGPQRKIEMIIKKSLLDAYHYHIACFLDPHTYRLMGNNDKDVAQTYIVNEAYNRNLSQQTVTHTTVASNTNSSTSSTTSSSNINNQLNNFLIECGLDPPPISSTNIRSNRTVKEEIAYYIDKVKNCTIFEEFWRTHQIELPCLSVLVRSFNIRLATSVPSESLFSVAAYVNRKQRSSMFPNALRCSMILRDADILATLL